MDNFFLIFYISIHFSKLFYIIKLFSFSNIRIKKLLGKLVAVKTNIQKIKNTFWKSFKPERL